MTGVFAIGFPPWSDGFTSAGNNMRNTFCEVILKPAGLVYQPAVGKSVTLSWPTFQIDQASTRSALKWSAVSEATLANGATECRHNASIGQGLTLTLVLRIASDSPIVRFRYELSADYAAKLTGRGDAITYGAMSLARYPQLTEVRLSEWVELHHSYEIAELEVTPGDFLASRPLMGPIFAAERHGQSTLLAYEHGSTVPDAFIAAALAPDRSLTLKSVHGNFHSGQSAHGFATVWFMLGSVPGDRNQLAAALRQFLLTRQSLNNQSRKPYIFYNTWNYQERNKHWYAKPYLHEMNQERMLREIDVAHDMGIEVFVIDTGWFKRTGDWRVNLERFPDGLKGIREKLEGYGMKLGLWFDNSAAVESQIGKEYADCRCSSSGKVWDPHVIWETEAAHRMCLVSRYWEAFADELIRVHRELGVCYFKWDAIGQYGCTDPRHFHGTEANAEKERGECYAFQLPLYMTRIVERISQACPNAIVDFDVTESQRAVGLAFLSAGKYFLINNGPYCWNFNVPQASGWPNGNPNLFFFPGPARTWICRQPLTFDKWVPMNLFMAHYLPDAPAVSQVNCVASLILGQNGIWGDLPALAPEGIALFNHLLGKYKQVRDDIAAASPIRQGQIGGCPETHAKINPATGRGAIVMFATQPGTYTYITRNAVAANHSATDGVVVTQMPDGKAKITCTFTGHLHWNATNLHEVETAKIVFFGT